MGRCLLSYAMMLNGEGPEEVSIESSGKPFLANSDLKCSITHCQDLIAVAICNQSVGIDIERWKKRAFQGVVDSYFHPSERQVFAKLSDEEKPAWFYGQWTKKEALAKAMGTGIYDTIGIDLSAVAQYLHTSVIEDCPCCTWSVALNSCESLPVSTQLVTLKEGQIV